MLFRFRSAEDLAQWSTFSDAELGGRSTAALELAPPAEEAVPQVRCFEGMGLQPAAGILLVQFAHSLFSPHALLAGQQCCS